MAKRAAKKVRAKVKVRARVAQAASIKEFSDAAIANIDNTYWESATQLLEGMVPVENYQAMIARLNALKEAGLIVKETLLDRDEDEREDEEERKNG